MIRDWGLGLGWSANRSALVVISSPQSPSPQVPSPPTTLSTDGHRHADAQPAYALSGTIHSAVAGLDPSPAIVKLWYLPARAAMRVEMIVLRDEQAVR